MAADRPRGEQSRQCLGRRRKDADLSHAQLAVQIGYSRQYISLAERATKGLPSAELVNALDNALRAGGALTALRQEAAAARLARRRSHTSVAHRLSGHLARRAEPSAAILELRETLMDYGYSFSHFQHVTLREGPASLPRLKTDLDVAFTAYQGSRFTIAACRVPALLASTQRAVHDQTATTSSTAYSLLALSYQLAASLLIKSGENDFAWIAAERGLNAAEHVDDPTIYGSLVRTVAFAMLATERLEPAMRLVESSAQLLKHEIGKRDAALSTYGTLFLVGTIAAARFGDRERAVDYLREADEAARRLGRDGNDLWTAFGPTNVAIHRINAAAELGDLQTVLDSVSSLDTSAVPVERQVRYLLDVARAYGLTGDREAALGTLIRAERMAGEHVRQHYLAKSVVHTLMQRSSGKPSIALEKLASRVKIVTGSKHE